MKTLNEAIKHCEEVARNNSDCKECCEEHLQLATWLKELKSYQERSKTGYRKFQVVLRSKDTPITIYAKDYQRLVKGNGSISHMFHQPRKDTNISYLNDRDVSYIMEKEMSV